VRLLLALSGIASTPASSHLSRSIVALVAVRMAESHRTLASISVAVAGSFFFGCSSHHDGQPLF
jgi:hypothetical protein